MIFDHNTKHNKNVRLLFDIFADYCIKQLNIENCEIKIVITSNIEDNLRGFLLDDVDNNKYDILIKDNMDVDVSCKTIAHELIHVHQFVYKNLSDHISKNEIEYEDTWWEHEAFKRSYDLHKKFIETKATKIICVGIKKYHADNIKP